MSETPAGVRFLVAGVFVAVVSGVTGFLVGHGMRGIPEDDESAADGRRARSASSSRSNSTSGTTSRPRAKAPPAEPAAVPVAGSPDGLRSEHDIEVILRSHLGHDPPHERVREVVVLRKSLFDAQRRVPQDWEDEALRRVIRSLKGEVPDRSEHVVADSMQLLGAAEEFAGPLQHVVADGPAFDRLFATASDGERIDVTKPPAKVREGAPFHLLFPEGVHEWDGLVARQWRPEGDVVFQGAGMDTTLVRLRGEFSSRKRTGANSKFRSRPGVAIVLRDLTLFVDQALSRGPGDRLRLERCRVVGWETQSRALFEGFRGFVYATDCRFEGGFASDGSVVLLAADQDEVFGRFERCRLRGPLRIARELPASMAKTKYMKTILGGGTWQFESCTFLEMEWPSAKDLEAPRDDALRFVTCLVDTNEDESVPERRSLAELNAAWAAAR